MANVNIFDKYGIKEVANVYFEALENDIEKGVYKGDIVLYLDSLKVSTIETTGETTAATGGYGNTKWIQWDYGKEINITLEDALMSLESLRFMLGGAIHKPSANDKVKVSRTASYVVESVTDTNNTSRKVINIPARISGPVKVINLGQKGVDSNCAGLRTQIAAGLSAGYNEITFKNSALGTTNEGILPSVGDVIRIFWEEEVTDSAQAVEVIISPDTFPGTYKVVGDTLIRAEKTGKDEPFQFIINKVKVQSNVTLTLQAEGDPTTFEMTLNVLRDDSTGTPQMMRLVRYSKEDAVAASGDDNGSVADVTVGP